MGASAWSNVSGTCMVAFPFLSGLYSNATALRNPAPNPWPLTPNLNSHGLCLPVPLALLHLPSKHWGLTSLVLQKCLCIIDLSHQNPGSVGQGPRSHHHNCSHGPCDVTLFAQLTCVEWLWMESSKGTNGWNITFLSWMVRRLRKKKEKNSLMKTWMISLTLWYTKKAHGIMEENIYSILWWESEKE